MNIEEFAESIRRIMVQTATYVLDEERIHDEKYMDLINQFIDKIKEYVSVTEPINNSWEIPDDRLILTIGNYPKGKNAGFYNPDDKTLALNAAYGAVNEYENKDWVGVIDKMHPVIFHEITHKFDFDRMKYHVDYISPRTKASMEFNAVFNSIIQKCYHNADKISKSKETDKLKLFHDTFGNTPYDFVKNTMDILLKNDIVAKEYPNIDDWHWKKRLSDTYQILRNRLFNSVVDK